MKVFHGFDHLPRFRNPVVTVGSYDGVHAGHRKLLRTIAEIAEDKGGESVVITFSPHPREVLGGDPPKLLTTLDEKIFLLEQAGVNNLIVAPFTPAFSRLSYSDFVRDYLVVRIGVSTLVVGYNHHFGHDKKGDFHSLGELSNGLGFDIYMVSRQDVDNDKVSSTVIRNLIGEGRMAEAAKFLGHPYFIFARAGFENGCVTPREPNKMLPPAGDYSVLVEADGGMVQTVLTVTDCGSMSVREMPPAPHGNVVVTFSDI